jgi:hypothetical protein
MHRSVFCVGCDGMLAMSSMVDADPCISQRHNCDAHAYCSIVHERNGVVTLDYECTCRAGYYGDGRSQCWPGK